MATSDYHTLQDADNENIAFVEETATTAPNKRKVGTAHVTADNLDTPAATPTLYALTLTTANTEYSQALPATCRRVSFQCRTSAVVRFAFAIGKVATPTDPYNTLKADAAYDSGVIKLVGGTLYLASATAGVVVEIEAWG